MKTSIKRKYSRIDPKYNVNESFEYGDRGLFYIESVWYSLNKNEFCYTVKYPKRVDKDNFRAYGEKRISQECKKLKDSNNFTKLYR
jgi:hypothetical protein